MWRRFCRWANNGKYVLVKMDWSKRVLRKSSEQLIFYLIPPSLHLLTESLEISHRYSQSYKIFCPWEEKEKELEVEFHPWRQNPWKPWLCVLVNSCYGRLYGKGWKPDEVRNIWKAFCCYTCYNGQIEQVINMYKIPLVMLHKLLHWSIFHWNFCQERIHLGQFPIVPCSNLGNFKSIMLILLKGKFHNRLSEVAPYKDCWLGKTYCWEQVTSFIENLRDIETECLECLAWVSLQFSEGHFSGAFKKQPWLASVAAPGLCLRQQRVSIRRLQPVKRLLSQVPRGEVLERETMCRCVGSLGSSARRLEPERQARGVWWLSVANWN